MKKQSYYKQLSNIEFVISQGAYKKSKLPALVRRREELKSLIAAAEAAQTKIEFK